MEGSSGLDEGERLSQLNLFSGLDKQISFYAAFLIMPV